MAPAQGRKGPGIKIWLGLATLLAAAHPASAQVPRPVEARFEAVLKRAEESGHWKAAPLGWHLLGHLDSLWTFVRREGVDSTNNAAERAVRPAVLWRKNSFGTQSERGRTFAERLLTVVASLRAQGRDVLEYLEAAIHAAAVGEAVPALAAAAPR